MTNEQIVKSEFDEAYKQGWSYWGAYLREAKKDLKMVMGAQWEPKVKTALKKQGRAAHVFNKTRRVIRLLEGYQRKHRLALKVDPIETGDDETASQLTGCLMWTMQYNNGYNVLSDAFSGGALKTGINLVNLYIDYFDDPLNGDIKLKRIPYNKFVLDPNFTERDLSDCTYLLRREYFDKSVMLAMMPKDRRKSIKDMHPKGVDDKYSYYRPPTNLAGDQYYRYDEMVVRKYNPIKILADPKTGAFSNFTGTKEQLKEIMQKMPFLQVTDGYKRTVELRILVEGEVLYIGPSLTGLDDFDYVPIMGFWEPEEYNSELKLQALARCIRDPQDELNKRRSKMLDIIDSQISTGWLVEENSVVNPAAMYRTGQGKVVYTKQGKWDKVKQLQSVEIPAGLFRLQEILDRDMIEIPGANDEMFGAPENKDLQSAGILSKLREAAGLTVAQDLFDNYRLAKRLVGRKMIQMIQRNFSPDKVGKIIAEQPTQEFYNKKFGKYDCTPTEGVLSDSQRQLYYAELRAMKNEGAPIPWSAIFDAAPLQWKNKLQKFLEAQDKAAQEQAAFQKKMDQLTAMLIQAKTKSDIASVESKTSQAVENRTNAMLDRIKAIKLMGKIEMDEMFSMLKTILAIEKMGQAPAQAPQGSK